MYRPLSFLLKKHRAIMADLGMIDKDRLAETKVKPDADDASGSDLPASRYSPRVVDSTSLFVLLWLYKSKYSIKFTHLGHLQSKPRSYSVPFSIISVTMFVVAVAGGTEGIGRTVFDAIKAQGKFEPIVLSRKVGITECRDSLQADTCHRQTRRQRSSSEPESLPSIMPTSMNL